MGISLRVLILEDNPSDAELMLHELRRAGYDPTASRVETEQEFLTRLEPAPELILADFSMPEFDSLRALETIKKRHLEIPFIIVSGTIGEERAVQIMQLGATDYIIKDRLGRLGQAVDQALARAHHKEEKRAIQHTAARLAAIVYSSMDAIVAKTLDGTITNWNPAAERLYGYSAQEIIGKNVTMLFPIGRRRFETPESFLKLVQKLLDGVVVPPYESVRVRKDGRRIEVLLSISPIVDQDGNVIGASEIGRDITQGKRSERFLNTEQAVTGILVRSSNLAEAGPRVLQTIAECLRWEVAVLWTVDREANVLRRMYTWHAEWADRDSTEALSQAVLLERGVGVAGRTWSKGESIWESGIHIDPHAAKRPALTCEGLHCGFGLPMRQDAEIVGVIEFYNSEIRELDQLLIATLENIGSQVSQFCERRRTEVALRASEEQYRTLANSLPGGVYACTALGAYDYCNQWWCDYTGLTAEQIIHGGWMEALHPDDVKQNLEISAESNRTGQPFLCEHRFRGADGNYRWFLDRSVPLKNDQGRIIKWYGTRIDIDEQKRSFEEIRASEDRFRNLVMSLPAAVYSTDRDGRILLFNEEAVRLWGRRPDIEKDRWCGSDKLYRLDGTLIPLDRCPMAMAIREGRCVRNEEMIVERVDGSRAFIVPYPALLRDALGEIVGAVNVLVDITEMKQLGEQFRQAQKMEAVGRLAAGVAHDFNNLLTVINGYSGLMLTKSAEGDKNRKMLQEIVRAGERAEGLTRQLLTFSRQQILRPRVLNLNAILADTEKMLRRLIGEDLELRSIKDSSLGNINADPGEIEQVLLNLAVNARDAMPGGGKLTFVTQNVELSAEHLCGNPDSAPGPYVLLAVSDNGCGMDNATQSKIFEPFFTTKGTKGTGLGLATIFGVVKQLRGKIDVTSEVGQGTTFKIYFPRVDEPVTPAACPSRVPGSLRGSETVLLAEDEAGVRMLTRHLLQENGYTVLEASSGAEAIRICEKHGQTIDLLITDVVMPRMSGRQLADQMILRWPKIKVLYVSGYTDDAVVRHGVYHDQTHFLQKPFEPDGLALKVREVLNAA